jgi:hypothetical protein
MTIYDDDEPCDCPQCNPEPEAIAMMKQQLALAVKKGAYLLDEQFPEWRRQINLGILNLASSSCCVLGQLYGDYARGKDNLGLWEDGAGSEYGFDFPTDPAENSTTIVWRALDELWTEHILDI